MNKIFLKSSEQMKEVQDSSLRLIITSPPYYNVKDYGTEAQIGRSSKSYPHYIESMLPVWKECYRILKPNGKLCINAPIMPMEKKLYSTHYNRDILNINNDIEYSILNNTDFYRFGTIIWDKGSTDQLMMGSYPYPPNFYFLNTVEFINVFVKDGAPEKIDQSRREKSRLTKEEWRQYISTIWRFPPERDRTHPAPFPPELPMRLIKMFSFKDDIILDPFMGSGTTAIAAILCNRKFIGYEINPHYILAANNRLDQLGQKSLIEYQSGFRKPDYENLEMLRKLLKPEIYDEDFILDEMSKGRTLKDILHNLYKAKLNPKN